jgi:hypothetical protein
VVMLLGGAALPLGDHVRKPSAGSADLRADLPPPVPQSCDGPVADRLGQRQGAEKVGEIVGRSDGAGTG